MPKGLRVRVSKDDIKKIRKRQKKKKETSIYKCKKKIIPGPWTEIETAVKVSAQLRLTENTYVKNLKTKTYQNILGTYPELYWWDERGWYPIYINIVSRGAKQIVEEHGIDIYLAACEKVLNSDENRAKYGDIILLKLLVNHTTDPVRKSGDRFVSCLAKTNKKNISGFAATRKRIYQVLP